MATANTTYRITATIEGLEKVTALKQAIQQLSTDTRPAAEVIDELRQKALTLGTASDATTKEIKTAISVLKDLRENVSRTGTEYGAFGVDLKNISSRLDGATTSVKNHTQAQIKLGQVVNANSSAINNYFNRSAQRQQEQIAEAVRRQTSPAVLALPAAGQTSFKGTVDAAGFGGGARRGTGTKENVLQVGSDPASKQVFLGAARTDADIRVAAGALGDNATVAKAAASATDQYQTQLEQLFNAIRKVEQTQLAEKNTKVAYSYKQVEGELVRVTAASNGSLNSLRQQRQLWEQLYNSVEKTDPAFARAANNIKRLDRDIARRSLGGQNRFQRFGQTAGAIAAGGVFGGPEGLIGATIGGIAGGPGGALGGAALGAQIGMIRQNIVGMGEFSAEVKKLDIALKNVSGSANEFAKAQQIVRLAGVELNVPILEATKGFTQLTASVTGAGGKVSDAEIVFRGVTEAIKASGGSAEDVQGAITAMSQIFSKGKVSAEELQGQLGERLPGAVTLFAQATGRSLPQLQKDLQNGVVGLNDVMKFAAALSDRYGASAARMAASTEDSTARMKVALDELRVAFGSIVKPVTASIQSIISQLATMSVRALRAVGLIKDSMSELGAVGRAKDLQTRAADAYRALGSGPQSIAEKKEALKQAQMLANAATPQKTLVGVQQNIRALQQARDVVKQITSEGLDERRIQLVQTVGNKLDQRIQEQQKALKTLQEQRKATEFAAVKDDNKSSDKAAKEAEQQANRQYQLDLQTAQSQKQFADAVFKYQTDLDRKRYELNQELLDLQRNNYVNSFTGVRREAAQAVIDLRRSLDALDRKSVEAALNVRQAQQEYTTASNVAAIANSAAGGGTAGVYMQGGYGPKGSRDYDPHFDIKRQDGKYFSRRALDQYVSVNGRPLSTGVTVPNGEFGAMRDGGARVHNARDYAFPGNAALTLTGGAKWLSSKTGSYGDNAVFMTPDGQIYRIIHGKFNAAGSSTQASQQRKGVKTAGAAAVEQLGVNAAVAEQQMTDENIAKQRAEIIAGYYQRITGNIRERIDAMVDEAAVTKDVNRLQLEGVRPELIDMERQLKQESINKQNQLNTYHQMLVDGQMKQDEYDNSVKILNADYAALSQGIRSAAEAQIAFNDALRVRQDYDIGGGFKEAAVQYIESVGTLKDATTKLALDGFKGVEDALFSLVTTGKANFKEFAASILKQTARMIIQQLVLRTIMQAIGAIGGGPSNALGSVESNLAKYAPLAKGGVFASNGIQPFAMGGIVDKPTLFKFANGGTGRLGLMGEAGPEAIVPLRRGRDGKLGIAGGGGSTTVNVSVDASGSPQVSGNGGQGEQLGRAIAGAVQQELIRQKRPGGILAQ